MVEVRREAIGGWFLGRLVATTAVLVFGIALLGIAADAVPVGALLSLVSVSVVASILSVASVLVGAPKKVVQTAQLAVDLAVIALCVHYSGGIGSRLSMLYFLPLVFAAYDLGQRATLVTAGASAFVVLGYSFLVAADRIHPPQIVYRHGIVDHGELVEGQILISLLLVVGYLAGEMAGRLQRKALELSDHEAQLDQVERETQSIVDNMGSGVLTLDAEGRVCRLNPAAERILGVDAAILASRPLADSLGSVMPVFVGQLMECLLEGVCADRHEVNIERGDGRVVPLGLSVNPLLDSLGERCGVVAVFQDLSAVVQMRERVRNQDRLAAMGELSATIAHEIRNPLASIRGSVEMLEGELELSDENARLFELIRRESARLNGMVEDFLEYARLRPPALRNCCVGDLLAELEQMVRSRDDLDAEAALEVVRPSEELVVHADEELMGQVFLNLALNAYDAMGGRGRLTVSVGLRTGLESEVVIRFLDEGPGIDDELAERIFEPFFTTKERGTGLGLPLAQRVVSHHGGKIEVRNVDGGGAEFAVHLPLIGIMREGILDAGRLHRPAAALSRS